MYARVLRCGGLVGSALYLVSGLLVFAHADFEAPPPPAPTMRAIHSGVTLQNFSGTFIVRGEELTARNTSWGIETSPWFNLAEQHDVPIGRAVWMLYRGSIFEETFDGDPEEGTNYAFVHHPLSASATTTLDAEFEMPMLGDPDTPSGKYTLLIAELPETYYIYDEEVGDYTGERAYTIQDIVNWIAQQDDFARPDRYRWLEFDYVAGEAPSGEPDPVIIIPGILGSEQVDGEWVIDPILHTYDDLIATLDVNGYTPGEDLFTFPYNWRNSNVETAVLLKEKIDEIKEICECGKVDLVAHSMGGLVARQYIQSDEYEDNVDQLIFLGTPHLGAPKAYLMWEAGEVNPPPLEIEDRVLKLMLEHEGYEKRYPTLFAYLRTEPIEAVRELLSTENYLFDSNDARIYPDNYPRNNFLEELNSNADALLNSGVEIFNFVGETGNEDTINKFHVENAQQYAPRWLNGYPEGFYENLGIPGVVKGQGDGTVPLTSASFITPNLVVTPHRHNKLPTKTQGDIYQILTGTVADSLIERFINLPNFKLILIKIFSPADLLVIAPDGKKIGKADNGQVINQIPHAFYTGFNTDTEFITILNPLDGEYKIFTQGTESGSYTLETNLISEATTTEASFTGNTAPGVTSQLNLDVQDGEISSDALESIVTYESTLADLDRINKLKWMNASIYKSLKSQLQTAKKSKSFIAKPLLQAMLRQLDAYRGKVITEQGYQILRADIEKLLM